MVAADIKRAEKSDKIKGLESIDLSLVFAHSKKRKKMTYIPKFEGITLLRARLLS